MFSRTRQSVSESTRLWRKRVGVEPKLSTPNSRRMMTLQLPPSLNWSQFGARCGYSWPLSADQIQSKCRAFYPFFDVRFIPKFGTHVRLACPVILFKTTCRSWTAIVLRTSTNRDNQQENLALDPPLTMFCTNIMRDWCQCIRMRALLSNGQPTTRRAFSRRF